MTKWFIQWLLLNQAALFFVDMPYHKDTDNDE